MKIIIVGAGRVGESVAEHLVSERNDITVIDENADLLADLQARFDLRGLQGNGTQPAVLEEAGARDADVLLACASNDAVNLVTCHIARQRFGTPRRIARLRAPDWLQSANADLLGDEGFGVSQVISPENAITNYVLKLVEYPEALQVRNFAGGLAALVSVRAIAGAPLVHHCVGDFAKLLPDVPCQAVAIYRRFANEPDRFVALDNRSVVLPNDEVFVLTAGAHIRDVLHALHPPVPAVRRMMLAGCGHVGLRLAQALHKRVQLKVLDRDKARCEHLATTLGDKVLVLNGDCTDEDLLVDEAIDDTDFFCALTNDDENNIMTGLLAKQLGANRVLSLVNRRSYAGLVHGTQIDVALSPAQAMMGDLLAHVRQGDMRAVHSVRRGQAEAVQIAVHGDRLHSRVVGRRIADLPLPADVRMGLVLRGLPEEQQTDASPPSADSQLPDAQVLQPVPDLVLQSGDHVLLFVPRRDLMPMVEKLFRPKAFWL